MEIQTEKGADQLPCESQTNRAIEHMGEGGSGAVGTPLSPHTHTHTHSQQQITNNEPFKSLFDLKENVKQRLRRCIHEWRPCAFRLHLDKKKTSAQSCRLSERSAQMKQKRCSPTNLEPADESPPPPGFPAEQIGAVAAAGYLYCGVAGDPEQ